MYNVTGARVCNLVSLLFLLLISSIPFQGKAMEPPVDIYYNIIGEINGIDNYNNGQLLYYVKISKVKDFHSNDPYNIQSDIVGDTIIAIWWEEHSGDRCYQGDKISADLRFNSTKYPSLLHVDRISEWSYMNEVYYINLIIFSMIGASIILFGLGAVIIIYRKSKRNQGRN